MISPMDTVRVKNNGTKVLTLKWDGQTYAIDPGQSVPIIAACAFRHFGDPRTKGSQPTFIKNPQTGAIDTMLPSRSQEIERLRFFYGAPLGGSEDDLRDLENLPKVTVMDLDGNEIKMVIHDPDGYQGLPEAIDPGNTDKLLEIITKMQDEIERLERRIDHGPDEMPEAQDESELPTDDAPTGRFKVHDMTKGIPAPSLEEVTR